ncbi:hypothetical protein ACWC4E_14310 [Streptomyces sp. NPDC001273]
MHGETIHEETAPVVPPRLTDYDPRPCSARFHSSQDGRTSPVRYPPVGVP